MSEKTASRDQISHSPDNLTLQATYLEAVQTKRSLVESEFAMNNPAAERIANNGFALLDANADGGRNQPEPQLKKQKEQQDDEGEGEDILELRSKDDPVIKEIVLPDGNHKLINQDTNTSIIKEPSDNGRVLEVTTNQGETTKYTYRDDGSIDAQQFVDSKEIGEKKTYPNAKVDEEGTLTWEDGQTSYLKRPDGYLEQKDKTTGTATIFYPDSSWATQKSDEIGIHTTTFADRVDNKKVAERIQFSQPQSLKLPAPTGEKETPGISSIATFYDPLTGSTIAQSATFAQQGLPATVNAFGGKVKFHASSIDIFRPDGTKAGEVIYYANGGVIFQHNDGMEKIIPIDTIHHTIDENSTERIGLSREGFTPSITTFPSENVGADVPKKEIDAPNIQTEKADQQMKIKALIDELANPKHDPRMKAKDALIEMGTEALPALIQASKSTDAEVKSLSQASIDKINEQESNKPLSRSSLRELQKFEETIFKAELMVPNTHNLSLEARAEFEKLIARVDGTDIGGLNKKQLKLRANRLAKEAEERLAEKFDNSMDNCRTLLPLSGTRGDASAAIEAMHYLEEAPERQAATEKLLVENAAYSSGRLRAIYASLLSNTGQQEDRHRAIKLLTDAISKDPDSAPYAEEDEEGVTLDGHGFRGDFLKAINISRALEDKQFVETFLQKVRNGELTIETLRTIQ